MPRDDTTLAGLRKLLETLPDLDEVFFQPNRTLKDVGISFGDKAEVKFSKNGYTKGQYGKIYYAIRISDEGDGTSTQFTIYVGPSAQTSANRKAVAYAIEQFLSTESTIITRDIPAQAFESA
ncbi:hypothetical protein C8Q70DRAFT_1057077 [Cubamyces menziesii]|uniref:Uncharacterized protein n=1 Tax=Trametes cubensis TaxID=1111947 RepID=A0AAD7X696_9APHY|nr:hypothetical protein C8Q70DRAFT_1057077 [Cubamyces menziesii]KAJ8462466.1 hypothetical protein ONZ51_g10886 [Trametes cubensis]